MQIQLKQTEIIAAISGYIAAQGISLVNKRVDIAFTAGRKESGLTADVTIEEQPLKEDPENRQSQGDTAPAPQVVEPDNAIVVPIAETPAPKVKQLFSSPD